MLLPAELLNTKLRTILGRLKDVADKIEEGTPGSIKGLSQINSAVEEQVSETDLANMIQRFKMA